MFEIGTSLREARYRQHLELTEVEQATKIRARYLRALEEETFDVLPAQTYVKGFLRTYADYLGLDGQLYVDEYNSRYATGEDELREPVVARRSSGVPSRHRRLERRGVVLALVGIAVLSALFIAAFGFGSSNKHQPIPNLGSNGSRTGAVTTHKPRHRSSKPRPPAKLRFFVIAVGGDCWMDIRTYTAYGVGKPLFTGTVNVGQSHFFANRGPLWVNFGNGNVHASLDGRVITIPPTGGRFVLTHQGIRPAA